MEVDWEAKAYDLIQIPNSDKLFVTLTYAQTLDGFIARTGQRTIISCPESLILTHAIRASREAILVGVQTCLIDNPSLLIKRVQKGPDGQEPKHPTPVIVDTRLELNLDARFIGRAIILASPEASTEKERQLQQLGAKVYRIPLKDNGKLNLKSGMELLFKLGFKSIMVEGGSKIINEFIDEQLADEIIVTVAPKLLGDGVRATLQEVELENVSWHQFGRDIVMFGRLA